MADLGLAVLWVMMEGFCHAANRGNPATSKCSSKLTFVMETQSVGGVALQLCESGCISVETPFFQKPRFILQNCFHGTFPSGHALLPPQLSRHWQFFMGFLSTFSLWWEAQQKLSSGRRLLLLLHARRQKWKDAKKFIKYHVSHFQLSKLFWFVRFISSFGGIFTLTVWGTSYFSLPVPEFPETMLCLTLSCVVKWTDRNHTRYLRYLRYSHERRQFKWFDKESTKSRQFDHIKKSKCWITSCGSTSNSVRQNYWLWKCGM